MLNITPDVASVGRMPQQEGGVARVRSSSRLALQMDSICVSRIGLLLRNYYSMCNSVNIVRP